VKHSYPFRKTK